MSLGLSAPVLRTPGHEAACYDLLPDELWIETFYQGLSRTSGDDDTKFLLLVSAVCSSWRVKAISTAPLWSFVSFTIDRRIPDPPPVGWLPRQLDRIQTYLMRSKKIPLDVSIQYGAPRKRAPRIYINNRAIAEKLHPIIKPHLHRCRSLFLQFRYDEQAESLFPLVGPMDLLETIEASVSQMHSGSYTVVLDDNCRPRRLRTLLLDGEIFARDIPEFPVDIASSLTAVRMTHSLTRWPSTRSFIEKCVALTYLKVCPHWEVSPVDPRPILPSLETLEIGPYGLNTFFTSFETPRLKHLILPRIWMGFDSVDLIQPPSFPMLDSLTCIEVSGMANVWFRLFLLIHPLITELTLDTCHEESVLGFFLSLLGNKITSPSEDEDDPARLWNDCRLARSFSFSGVVEAVLPSLEVLHLRCSDPGEGRILYKKRVFSGAAFGDFIAALLMRRPKLRIVCWRPYFATSKVPPEAIRKYFKGRFEINDTPAIKVSIVYHKRCSWTVHKASHICEQQKKRRVAPSAGAI